MKRLLIALCVLSLAGAARGRAEGAASPDSLVWCGLDYSKVKMIGTQDFREPEQIFPGMLTAWNGLFVKEVLPQLEKAIPSVTTDLQAVESNNQKASAKQIDHQDGSREEMVTPSHITPEEMAKMVRSYDLKNSAGVGLVFIIDRLVKAQETGCLYVVFFDIASRKVLLSERRCEKAGGFGFRNFWFRPVKDAAKPVPGMFKQAKAKR